MPQRSWSEIQRSFAESEAIAADFLTAEVARARSLLEGPSLSMGADAAGPSRRDARALHDAIQSRLAELGLPEKQTARVATAIADLRRELEARGERF